MSFDCLEKDIRCSSTFLGLGWIGRDAWESLYLCTPIAIVPR